ncbi:putative NAD/FAD-dependent oxidoreductase [Rheinheimera pacifica]|uniref:NAD(P)/FAD-dependent oxidoreductase n=1 Tax=Rheinheimera pacifica TaxID=173990 RepID=UPI00285AE159|nr:FAD-dependent oxidoreductase [Rheinheimera pacifica]MDR6984989.1 putative NAD/FAD-dependent oxidoreductase [Rheinheimera pacifica]
MTIAIIGAGIAGAACAARLTQQGHQVVVFDKGRSAGGRMSSKRTEQGYLDLGAQYFTARSEAFQAQCHQWLQADTISRWNGRLAEFADGGLRSSPDNTARYIGQPAMQAPVVQLLGNISLHCNCAVDQLQFDGNQWQLFSAGNALGSFSQLVLAIPQQQARQLLQTFLPQSPKLATLFAATALLPCWAVNIQLEQPLLPYDAIFVKNHPLSWLARQASKPGRCSAEHWLLHFNPAFSAQHLEAGTEAIAEQAVIALQHISGQPIKAVTTLCHRWRYAQQAPQYPVSGAVYLPALALGLAGDWLNGGRVENAWLSGVQLAQELVL